MYNRTERTIAEKLAASGTKGQNARDNMRRFLDQLEAPAAYAGHDFDRVQHLATWLTCLGAYPAA